MSGPIGSSQWMYSSSTSLFNNAVGQSLRLNGTNSYLSKNDFGSATNNSKCTFSTWIKTSNDAVPASYNHIIGAGSSNIDGFGFTPSEKLQWIQGGANTFDGNRLIRDTSAWYHFFTTWNATDNQLYIYVNGELELYSTSSINALSKLCNTGHTTYIGRRSNVSSTLIHGYLADTVFLDGTIGSVSDFGETSDGVWIPKNISAAGLTFGDNGFHLDYADSSDLGKDVSGKGNHFTSNNLAAEDQVSDSPENNWCVLNRLKTNESLSINQTFSEGNLDFTSSEASSNPAVTSTFAVSSGKWYWEVYIRNYGNTVNSVGIASTPNDLERDSSALYSKTTAYSYQANGSKHNNSDASYGDTWTTGDIISVALDLDAGAVYFYKNGTIQNSGTAAFTGLSGEFTSYSLVYTTAGGAQVYNFGQDDSFAGNKTSGTAGASDSNGLGTFYYSVPSGYNSLCASNLPDPTIGPGQTQQADNFFDIALYTGNGTALASGGNVITGMELAPEFLWLKRRNSNANAAMYDVVQGVGKGVLPTHNTYASFTTSETVGSFNSDGFTLGSNSTNNNNTTTNIAWAWKLGGAPTVDNSAGAGAVPTAGSVKIDGSNSTANLAGTIPALRQSANTTAGISITKYVGTGSVGTVAHSLSEAPELVFTKSLDSTKDFLVYSDIAGPQYYLRLNGDTDGIKTLATSSTPWNDTAPTNSVVTLGTTTHHNNAGDNNIMWAFHSVEGYCKITEYTGNGNFQGPFCFLGFRARFFIIRSQSSSNTRRWPLFNTETYTFNSDTEVFFRANETDSEISGSSRDIDILSNGLKIRGTSGNINNDGERYLVWAYAENPFKFANAR